MIRIIAGEFKGHKLKSGLDRPGFRPTKDRVKESLFSILGDMQGKEVLDLFAGSGNLGFETLSRGAKTVTFIENNYRQTNILRENAEKLKVLEKINIIPRNTMIYLKKSKDVNFDLVLADPPYQFKSMALLAELLINRFNTSQIVLETSPEFIFPNRQNFFEFDEKIYGNTKLTIFKVKNEKSTLSGNI
jgi:16S rRNA (guanine966-N2)-methyltransferase